MFNCKKGLTRIFFFLLTILICSLYSLFSFKLIYAQTVTPTPSSASDSQKVNDLNNKIAELEKKLAETRLQENSLSSQIGAMDSQIKLTEYRIEANKKESLDLSLDIDSASKRIDHLENSLTDVSKILINRIKTTYEVGGVQAIHVLASSSDLTNFFARANYLRIVQQHDKRLMYNAQQARNDYDNQKTILENKRKKIEELKAQLEGYNKQLDKDKEAKQVLLTITKNDEATYQQRLQAARAEQAAITKIFSGGGNAVAVGPVNEGDIVGTVINGRSACSTGAHLHFETHSGGGYQNPAGYLTSKSVIWDNGPDAPFSFSGSLPFPISDPIRIVQGFGMTYYARELKYYSGGPHTGIDMYSPSLTVHAVKSGTLYRGSIACGGGQLPFARVDHDGGFQTYYLHIYP